MRRHCLLVAFAAIAASSSAVASERQQYCEIFEPRATITLLDRTDPFDDQDKALLTDGAGTLLDTLEPGERLVILTLTDDFSTSVEIFDECMPGCPDAGGILGDIMKTCSDLIARRDLIAFRQSLAESLLAVLDEPEEHSGSAILETLNAVGRQYASRGLRRLVIFSDLIENSDLANFARLDAERFNALYERLDALHLIPPLAEVTVVTFGFGRMHGKDGHGLPAELLRQIEDFWQLYFTATGVESLQIGQRLER